ncbi:MAG TPA: hypothetical protein VLN58_02485 [Verrucomicrobiae bacterium]|nr:hypothetical protein [Verrucomicrobiae bacterium]
MDDYGPDDFREELLGRRGPCPIGIIYFHHGLIEETGEIIVYVRIVRTDGTDALGIATLSEAMAGATAHPDQTQWLTRIKARPSTLMAFQASRMARLDN